MGLRALCNDSPRTPPGPEGSNGNGSVSCAAEHPKFLLSPLRDDVADLQNNGAVEYMSYKVIARKYRPQTFREIVGQQHVTKTIANAINSNRVAHAYIFAGVRGVGKTTTARILAKALNCEKGTTADPDGTCASCIEISEGRSLDVLEIDAASNRGIDQIRELREMVRYAPANSRYKVVILDEAHQLTDEASNALLKTLEEPPDRVVFILATTRAEDLVETIKSRAQLFQFRALSFKEIAEEIERITTEEKISIEPGAVAVLARAAEGSVRDGLSLLEQAISYSGDAITDLQVRELLGVVAESVLDDLVEAISQQSAERALSLVHRLIQDGQNLQHFCREAIRHFRNLLVARVCGATSDLVQAPKDERERIAEQAALFTEEDLTRFFNTLMATDAELRRAPDPRLHLELGLLKLINAKRLAPLEEVLAELRGENSGTKPASKLAPGTPARSMSAGGSAMSSGDAAGGSARDMRTAPGTAHGVGSSGAAVRMAPAATLGFAPKLSNAATNASPISAVSPQAAPLPTKPAAVIPITSPSPDSRERKEIALPVATSGVATRNTSDASKSLSDEQIEQIKSSLQGQKFLLSMLDSVTGWEVENGEMRLFFHTDNRSLSEMLQSREPMERLRTALTQVLGQQLRVCVKLDSSRAPAVRRTAKGSELRARFEEDPIVRVMLEKFGGQISNVKRPGGE
jgi:DNA polymerase-3 subunit gamma/tau